MRVESEHLTRAGSAARSAVLLPLELARRARGCLEEGSVSRPGPQQAEARESLRTTGLDAPPPRALFVDLQHPRSLSCIISGCKVCRDYGRDARLSRDESSCGVVSFGESLASRTADARLLLGLPPRADGSGSPDSRVPPGGS